MQLLKKNRCNETAQGQNLRTNLTNWLKCACGLGEGSVELSRGHRDNLLNNVLSLLQIDPVRKDTGKVRCKSSVIRIVYFRMQLNFQMVALYRDTLIIIFCLY